MNELNRGIALRNRAEDIERSMADLPEEARRAALLRQTGLKHLAAMEDWIAVPPKGKFDKFDYNLRPREAATVKPSAKPRGRKPRQRG